MTVIRFRLELIGGPYDGERGLGWTDDGEHEPPAQIHVGECTVAAPCDDGDCPGRAHVWYWAPEYEDELPARGRLVPYARADVEVTGHARGVARYVCSQGVSFAAVFETFEAVPAGAMAFDQAWDRCVRDYEWTARRWRDYVRSDG